MNWALVPIAHAETIPLVQNIKAEIINPLIGLLIAVGLVVFMYGLIEMIRGGDSEDARAQGRQHIIWGLAGMFIMVAVLGILNLIIGTIGTLN